MDQYNWPGFKEIGLADVMMWWDMVSNDMVACGMASVMVLIPFRLQHFSSF